MIGFTGIGGFFWLKGLGWKSTDALELLSRSFIRYSGNWRKLGPRKNNRKNLKLVFCGVVLLFIGISMLIAYVFLFTTDGYYGPL